jgi:hypothetical protein
MNLVLGHGTWGRSQPWHLPGSALRAEAEGRGFTVYDFLWSGILAGVPTELPGDPLESASGADEGTLLPWLDAGEKLVLQLKAWGLFDDPALCCLSHSHMLQVGCFAVLRGARFQTWLSISGPIRRDMQRARRIARDGIGRWVQFADPAALSDTTIVEGQLFDGGGQGPRTRLPEGSTVPTPGTGHSGLVNDPALRATYALWEQFP